jgi:hypothetical protein
MDEITIWMRVARNLIDRISGPMNFRFILQPVIASIFAIIAGLKDAKAGKPPYFWGLLTGRAGRLDRIKDGWKSVGKVVIVALVLDIAYQIIVLHFVYLAEAIIVAFVVVIAPYLILRELVTLLAAKQ